MPTPDSKPRRYRWLLCLLGIFTALLLTAAAYIAWTYHGISSPVQIYRGITYSCEVLPTTPQSGGLVHLARVDLNEPSIEFYITPIDQSAPGNWEYRLERVGPTVNSQGLAVAVNGTLFHSDSFVVGLPGDWARALETVVANRAVNHVDPNSYLLWWDDQRIAHLELSKPPSPLALTRAVWGIGGQNPQLNDGKVSIWAGEGRDRRTMIAADPPAKLVWLACFDQASGKFAAEWMAQHGAKIGVCVDGGSSMSMAIGKDASKIRTGRVVGGWRPVATQFGFKAMRVQY